jgi:uncharacterized membrane protein YbhN (UPF0104 family)
MTQVQQHTPRISRKWMIRAAGSALLLIILFWLLPWDSVVAGFRSTPPSVFASVFLLFLMAHVGAALKWRLLLGPDMPVIAAIRAHFAGLAANLCLPGAIGGDAVRAGFAQASLGDGARVVAVALMDRVIDMFALLTLSVIGLILTREAGADISIIIQTSVFLMIAVAGFLALPRVLQNLWTVFPKLPGRGFGKKLGDSFGVLAARPVLLAGVFLASTAVQLVLVLIAWWLAVAAGADVALGPWLFAWPLAKLVAVLPVSLNGLGLREATLASFLVPFGANAAAVVAAGLMWQAILFSAGGFGALVLVTTGRGLPFAGKKDVVSSE